MSRLRETETQVGANLKRAGRLRQPILSKAFSGKLACRNGKRCRNVHQSKTENL
jgi:hypothetical protein